MGVHNLGKANIFNSGFHGHWIHHEQVKEQQVCRHYAAIEYKYLDIKANGQQKLGFNNFDSI